MLKFVGLLSRIVEKVCDDIVEPLGFPADNIDEVLFVFFERYQACQFLDRAGHGRQRLPNFVCDGGGKPPQGGHAFFGRSEEHTSELQSQSNLVCRLLLEKQKNLSIISL